MNGFFSEICILNNLLNLGTPTRNRTFNLAASFMPGIWSRAIGCLILPEYIGRFSRETGMVVIGFQVSDRQSGSFPATFSYDQNGSPDKGKTGYCDCHR